MWRIHERLYNPITLTPHKHFDMKEVVTIKTIESSLSNCIPAMMKAFEKYPYHVIIDMEQERCGTLNKVVFIVMKKRPWYQRVVIYFEQLIIKKCNQ